MRECANNWGSAALLLPRAGLLRLNSCLLPLPIGPAQALLEERRRARVDLQPLLQQLSSRLAQVLASGSGGGAGSSSSGALEAATLSAVRQACLDGGGPGVQASMQVR